jgi:hypothetical protein
MLKVMTRTPHDKMTYQTKTYFSRIILAILITNRTISRHYDISSAEHLRNKVME